MSAGRKLLDMRSIWIGTAVTVAAALSLSACGDSASSSPSSVFDLTSTNYVVQSTTPSTVPPTTDPSGVVAGEQEYTIVGGDVPINVAKRFGVTLDALNLANALTPGYPQFFVGLKIKIPAGGITPSATTTLPGQAGPPTNTSTTVAGGQSNCQAGSYVIVANDLPSTVAKKFDVTVAQLDAANVGTKGYTNFVVGITIVIPPKADC